MLLTNYFASRRINVIHSRIVFVPAQTVADVYGGHFHFGTDQGVFGHFIEDALVGV